MKVEKEKFFYLFIFFCRQYTAVRSVDGAWKLFYFPMLQVEFELISLH